MGKAGKVIGIVGIDTDIGKTIATGLLAKAAMSAKIPVITQKLVQTGCQTISDDIDKHREIMGVDYFDEDREGKTCPYLFQEPCSPHLAARLEDKQIRPEVIDFATAQLQKKYELILLEAAGGVFVPLNDQLTILDYFKERSYPVILVASNRVGSINHTALSLEAMHSRRMSVSGVVYNRFAKVNDLVTEDSRRVIQDLLIKYGYRANIIDMHHVDEHLSGQHPFDIRQLQLEGIKNERY